MAKLKTKHLAEKLRVLHNYLSKRFPDLSFNVEYEVQYYSDHDGTISGMVCKDDDQHVFVRNETCIKALQDKLVAAAQNL